MNKIIKKTILYFVIMSIAFLAPCLAFAEAGAGEATKDYPFTSKTEEGLSYDAPQSITIDGQEYVLDDITYEVIKKVEPYSIEKRIEITNLDDFKETIKEVVGGKEIILKAEKPEWDKKEVERDRIIKQEDRYFAENEEIPGYLVINGEVYYKTGVKEEIEYKDLSAPAYFTCSDKAATMYLFNGKFVEITGSVPVWQGWQEDILDYLKVSADRFIVESIAWNGDFSEEEGSYTREATVSGKQVIYNYLASFVYDSEQNIKDEDREFIHTATVVYTEEAEPYFEAVAHAKYVLKAPEKTGLFGLGKTATVLIGAGLGILALGAAAFIVIGSKKRREKES